MAEPVLKVVMVQSAFEAVRLARPVSQLGDLTSGHFRCYFAILASGQERAVSSVG